MKQCPLLSFGADDGNRTRVSSLGSWRSTIELHLRSVIIIHPLFPFVKHCQKFFPKQQSAAAVPQLLPPRLPVSDTDCFPGHPRSG